MHPPAQGDTDSSPGPGNTSFGSSNATIWPDENSQLNVTLNAFGLVGICFGIMLFFSVWGTWLAYKCRYRGTKGTKGYIGLVWNNFIDIHEDMRDVAHGTTLGKDSPDWDKYLSSADDKMVPIGTVHLQLYSTRRQLVQAFNKRYATLGVQNSVKRAWSPNEFATDYLDGFELGDIYLSKWPVANHITPLPLSIRPSSTEYADWSVEAVPSVEDDAVGNQQGA